MVVASPSYLRKHGRPKHPDELARHDTIAFMGYVPTAEWRFADDGKELSVRVTPRLVTNSGDAAVGYAIQGGGLALALSYQVREAVAGGELVEVLAPFSAAAAADPGGLSVVAAGLQQGPRVCRDAGQERRLAVQSINGFRGEDRLMRIVMRRMTFLVAACCLATVPAKAQSVAEFYAGKQITLTVGSTPGGGYDTQARLVARHIGRHIPGNPTVVVQNMPAAGSLAATNHMFNIAPKDGSAIAFVQRGMLLIKNWNPRRSGSSSASSTSSAASTARWRSRSRAPTRR